MTNNLEILKTIQELEKQLNKLKLELTENESKRKPSPIEIGDKVIILNPRVGQGSRGTVIRLNRYTNRATVEAKGTAGQKQKIVRAIHNVRKEE